MRRARRCCLALWRFSSSGSERFDKARLRRLHSCPELEVLLDVGAEDVRDDVVDDDEGEDAEEEETTGLATTCWFVGVAAGSVLEVELELALIEVGVAWSAASEEGGAAEDVDKAESLDAAALVVPPFPAEKRSCWAPSSKP